jgi:hypothetical protein
MEERIGREAAWAGGNPRPEAGPGVGDGYRVADEVGTLDAPVLSVVMPMLNASGTVRAAVSSVLVAGERLGGKVEVIVIDDGSTDGSVEVARGAAPAGDGRVRVWTAGERTASGDVERGPGAARNFGLERCRGAYVMCVDSDDVVEADGPARLLACAEAAGRAGKTRAACGPVRLGGATLAPLGRSMVPPLGGVDERSLRVGSVVTTGAAVLTEADRARAVRMENRYVGVEDWDWWRKVSEGGVVWASVGGPAVCTYRVRAGSLTKDLTRIARDSVLAAEAAMARGFGDDAGVRAVRRRTALEAATRSALFGMEARGAVKVVRDIGGAEAGGWSVGEVAGTGAWGVVLGLGEDPGVVARAREHWGRLLAFWEVMRSEGLTEGDAGAWAEAYAGEAASRRSIARRLLERVWAGGRVVTLVGLGQNAMSIVDEARVLGVEVIGADDDGERAAGWAGSVPVTGVAEAVRSAEAVIVTPTVASEGLRARMNTRTGATYSWSEAWAEERRRLASVLRGG